MFLLPSSEWASDLSSDPGNVGKRQGPISEPNLCYPSMSSCKLFNHPLAEPREHYKNGETEMEGPPVTRGQVSQSGTPALDCDMKDEHAAIGPLTTLSSSTLEAMLVVASYNFTKKT